MVIDILELIKNTLPTLVPFIIDVLVLYVFVGIVGLSKYFMRGYGNV